MIAWKSFAELPGVMFSELGDVRVMNQTTREYERYEPFVDPVSGLLLIDIDFGWLQYRSTLAQAMMRAFYRGDLRGVSIYYRDADPLNCQLDNLDLWRVDVNGEMIRVGYRMEDGYRRLDRRGRGRIEIVETGEVFDSASAVARHIGGQGPNVHAVLRGRLKTHKGYSFRYI